MLTKLRMDDIMRTSIEVENIRNYQYSTSVMRNTIRKMKNIPEK